MNTLREIVSRSGLNLRAFCREYGLPYNTLRQHVLGLRAVSPEMAMRYEGRLGIPRSSLRPDLWPPKEQPEQAARHE